MAERAWRAEYSFVNREKKNRRQAEKIMCECGVIVSKAHKSRHEKSKRHMDKVYGVRQIFRRTPYAQS